LIFVTNQPIIKISTKPSTSREWENEETSKEQYSLRLRHAAIIATGLVLVAGFAMISPFFLRGGKTEPEQRVMLSFGVSESNNVGEWCKNLSSVLNSYNIGATVFIVGKVAEQYPQIVSYFGNKVDVGSQTYDNIDLTSIPDYSLKLEEVQEGKTAVDDAGNLYSRVFRAPFGATDQDIYSLLSRSGIMADFSYDNQYNLYQDGQFVRHDAAVYEGRDYSPDFFLTLPNIPKPLIIVFDNTYPISSIESFISGLKKGHLEFRNASQLAGFTLTSRR
jgi:peptidoglycan/xylan/chitin deacetylase (PgdA/CDA1 family)